MGRPSSPTAGFAATARTAASPVCRCAARMCGCPAGTAPTPGGLRSQASAARSGCATRERGWGPSPSQPKDLSFLALSLPRPLASPAQNGAQPGAPAQPPVGWVWPPECPTRTTSAAWRPSAVCAYSGPAHPPGSAAPGTVPFRARLRTETRCPPPPAGNLGCRQQSSLGPPSGSWRKRVFQASKSI